MHAEDSAGLDRGGEHELRRGGAPRRGRLRAGRRRVRGARARPDRSLRRSGRRRAVDLRGHARGPAAAGHRRRHRPPAGHRHRVAQPPLRRLGRGLLAAGVRLLARPRTGAGPGRRPALLRGPDDGAWVRGPRAPRARGARLGAGGRADRLADGRADLARPRRVPVPHHLSRLPPAHGPRPAAVGELGRALRPCGGARARTRPRPALPRARGRARRGRRARLLRARHRAARALVVRGPGVARDRARGGRRARGGPGHGLGRPRARSGRRAGSRAVHVGRGQGPVHLGRRRASPSWRSEPGAPSCATLAAAGREPGRRRRSSALRASCWPSSRATGRS